MLQQLLYEKYLSFRDEHRIFSFLLNSDPKKVGLVWGSLAQEKVYYIVQR